MGSESGAFAGIAFEIAAIFVGAGFLATLFIYARQPVILAYIATGILLGPRGLGLIHHAESIEQMARLGVMLLLFIMGLDLQPMRLLKLFRQTAWLTLATSGVFFAVSALFALLAGLSRADSLILGACMMFSSTVIVLKLMPTTTLHQKHAGELMTSVLLFQDILAILLILALSGQGGHGALPAFAALLGGLLGLSLAAFLGVRFLLVPLMRSYDVISEYMFLLALAWCLFCAQAGHLAGLSHEMGAFIGGLAIGSNRVALVIAQELKAVREFFLILFFFAVGARFGAGMEARLLSAGALFGVGLVFLKSRVFRLALERSGESAKLSAETGDRLAQASEFSLLAAFAAAGAGVLSGKGETMVQWVALVTFVVSTYRVVSRYPTPIAHDEKLRQH